MSAPYGETYAVFTAGNAPNRDQWAIIVYSAAGFVITSAIVSFQIGCVFCCLCRCCHRKKTRKLNMIKTLRPSVTYKKPDHVYDEIDHDIPPKPDVGTKKNEAYYSTVNQR